MANTEVFKIKNGLQAGRYLNTQGIITSNTEGWSLENAYYTGNSFALSSTTVNSGIFFKPDGTKFYVSTTSDGIDQYDLTTAWDISTASFSNSISSSSTFHGVFLKSDGTRVYAAVQNLDVVYQWNLSTAWDLSTAGTATDFSVNNEETIITDLYLKSDGTELFIVGGADNVTRYSLSTAWDITTASFTTGDQLSVISQDGNMDGLFFKPDGTYLYTVGRNNDRAYEYYLSTAWDITTAYYTGKSFLVSSEEVAPRGFYFKSDGSKFFLVGSGADAVLEYSVDLVTQSLDLSAGSFFSITLSDASTTTFAFTNPPTSGLSTAFTLEVNGDGSTITWPNNLYWHNGAAPDSPASGERYVYSFITVDGGTSYYGKLAGSDFS